MPVTNIFEAMRVFMGSAYVNDFNMFGRTYRVTAQADGDFRLDPESVSKIRVRSTDGQMVPLGSLVTFKEIAGPERVPRYNLFPSAEVQGAATAGHQLRPGARRSCARWPPEKLPHGVNFEWTDLSYQEAKVGRTGYYIFVLSVVFVFLALSAQYESWSLPLAILLIVPMCLFSAAFGVWLHGREINILTQVGFVVLIALAAKNAILIVEFARQLEEQGKDTSSAAVEACRLRLRPILMTSLAFTLGVVPLYLAVGAGAEMRIALGTAVFWGMIGVTLFGLIFTPVFYVVIRRLTGHQAGCPRRGSADAGAPAAGGVANRLLSAGQRAARFSANEARPSAASGERRLAAWLSTSASKVCGARSRPRRSAARWPWSRPSRRGRSPAAAATICLAGGGQLGQRHDLVREADAQRLGRAEALAGQRIAAQLAHADGVAELRKDDGRGQSPAHLGDREDGVVGGDHDIAGGDDAGAAAEAAALHQRDRRHGQPVEPVDGLGRGAADAYVLLSRGGRLTAAIHLRSAPAWKCRPLPLQQHGAQAGVAGRARPWPRAGPGSCRRCRRCRPRGG